MKVLLLVLAMMSGNIEVITEGDTYLITESEDSYRVDSEQFLTKEEALDYIIELHDDDMGFCGEVVRLSGDNKAVTLYIPDDFMNR